jgi:FkbM family methyltransferase
MKQLLRKALTDRQYSTLSRLRRRILPDFRYPLGRSAFFLIGLVLKMLPDGSLVTLKSGINVVKKLDYQRREVFLSVDSEVEYRVRLHSCEKEPETVEWIETFMSEGDVLYDVGANIGAYSLVAAKFFDGKVKVYAFEPAFLNFAQLCKNLVLNRCQESVVPLQIALSDRTSMETFNYYNLVPGGAIHALGEAIDYRGDAFKPVSKQPVLSFRTDDFVRQFHMPAPNHIKIDVDGTEFSVLMGMSQVLVSGAVRSMMVELNEGRGSADQIKAFLAEKGFVIHSKHRTNHIFVRRP